MGGDDEGDGVEFPWAVHAAGVAVDVVGDAVFGDGAAGLVGAGGEAGGAEAVEGVGEVLVVGAEGAVWGEHFIPCAFGGGVVGEEGGGGGEGHG